MKIDIEYLVRLKKLLWVASQKLALKRLGISDEQWLTLTTEFEKHFCYAAGAEQLMNQFKEHTGHQRIRGMGKAKTLLRCA
ncbi:MAG: hypothetical protein ACI9LX_003229 [Paraglaciecola sp.]